MRKILIVDDDEEILKLTAAMVKIVLKKQCLISEASSKQGGEEILRVERPDVLITDFNLGDGFGTELIQLALESNPACIAILMSGGLDITEAAQKAVELKLKNFLSKPFGLDQIRAMFAINQML